MTDPPVIFPPILASAGSNTNYHLPAHPSVAVALLPFSGLTVVTNEVPVASPKPLALFAMYSGVARYVPVGGALPEMNTTASAGGALVIVVNPLDFIREHNWQPVGIKPVKQMVYDGIVEAEVRKAFEQPIKDIKAATKIAAYRKANSNNKPATGFDLDGWCLDRFMLGLFSVYVTSGSIVGGLPLMDPVRLYCFGSWGTPKDVSAVEVIRAAPNWAKYASPLWHDHPLVVAMTKYPTTLTAANQQPPLANQASDFTITDSGQVYGPNNTLFAQVKDLGMFNDGTTRIATFLSAHPSLFTISSSAEKIISAVSDNEGYLEAINTYDDSFLTFGCLQWTLGRFGDEGELPGLLYKLNQLHSTKFNDYFGQYGITLDVPSTSDSSMMTGHIILNGDRLDTTVKKSQFRTALWAYRFWRAGHDDDVREVEIRHAIRRIKLVRDARSVKIGTTTYALEDIVKSEYGMALLLDEHTNRPYHVMFDPKVTATIQQAVAALAGVTNGIETNPADWDDADEEKLLSKYIEKRNSRPDQQMTKTVKRAQHITDLADDGTLSKVRPSYVP